MPDATQWRQRCLTASVLLRLMWSRTLIQTVPFENWRRRLGLPGQATDSTQITAIRLGRLVQRMAERTPITFKCLPQAITLSALLRKRRIPHRVVIAARPASSRHDNDKLHAWVEVNDCVVLGDLPGPWMTVLRIPPG